MLTINLLKPKWSGCYSRMYCRKHGITTYIHGIPFAEFSHIYQEYMNNAQTTTHNQAAQ
jgi:hypothetical protein